MKNPLQLSKIQITDKLSSSKAFDRIVFVCAMIKDSGSKGDIYTLVQDLDHLIRQNVNELGNFKQQYEDLLLEMRLSAINLLSDSEIEEILKSKILFKHIILLLPVKEFQN